LPKLVALGEEAGLDRIRLCGVVQDRGGCHLRTWAKLKGDEEDISPTISDSLMNKDFGLIFDLANAVGARMPPPELLLRSMRGQARQGRSKISADLQMESVRSEPQRQREDMIRV